MKKAAKYFLIIFCICTELFSLYGQNNSGSAVVTGSVELPNGWKISPVGVNVRLGDLPMKMLVHPSQRYAVIQNAGQSDQSLMVIETKNGSVTDSVTVDKTFYGMCWGMNGELLYVSGANNNRIEIYKFINGKLHYNDSLVLGKPWPFRISPTAMICDDENKNLYVVSKEDSAVRQVDLTTKKVINNIKLQSAGYDIRMSKDNQLIFVSEWGNASVAVFDKSTLDLIKRISVGSNPNELYLDFPSNRLFVACGNDNTVHIVDVKKLVVSEIIVTAAYPNAPTGSTPNGLSVYKNKLFVANADNYNIAVFDIKKKRKSKLLGFIPAGWYPTQVAVVAGNVLITNGKGVASQANPEGPNPVARKNQVTYQGGISNKKVQYIGGLFRGSLQILSLAKIENPELLKQYTQQAITNMPYSKGAELYDNEIPESNPIPGRVGDTSPIKHVFYIIKENRTYDQVLSDVAGGDGDTSLLLFGEQITPNQHKLVKEFVLLDHFYVDAEVSADGHNWSTGAMANDFTEKTWPTSYGGRGGDYVYEGQQSIAYPNKGFIWDHAKAAGISYRTYGEFADDYKANIKALEGHFCSYFTSWDERVKDSLRFFQWKRDFDSLIAISKVPQLNTLRFINDHTEGVRKGRPTPFAHVADNDLAVGMFVEYLSKSPIWNSSVVFILEDDAQNGPDHIDAHRSTAYVAGGMVKRKYIDHTHYTTSSMLRTMELILGMKPMSQYDAGAKAMWRCFSDTVDNTPFLSVPSQVNLNEVNGIDNPKSTAYLMRKSEKLLLYKEDVDDDGLMNELLWKYVKGESSALPPVKRKSH